MNLFATYAGIVEKVEDPEKLGRVKVRVPHLYGIVGQTAGYIGTNQLPWAMPSGMPAGGSAKSGGFSMLPEPGDHVWVRFLDGEPEKPIWEWGMQTQNDAKSLRLHSYDTRNGQVGKPDATRWTRYGHLFEIIDGAITITTSKGYRMFMLDAGDAQPDGHIKLATPKGNYLQIDDTDDSITLGVNQDFYLVVLDEINAQCRTINLTAVDDVLFAVGGKIDFTSTLDLDFKTASKFMLDALDGILITTAADFDLTAASDIRLTSVSNVNIAAAAEFVLRFSTLRLGATASEPFVLGTQLTIFFTTLMAWLDTHIHPTSSPGAPTGPPTVPSTPVFQPQLTTLTSKVITGT